MDGREDVLDLIFRQSYQSLTSDKLVYQLRNKKLYSDTRQNTFLAFFFAWKKIPKKTFFYEKLSRGGFSFILKKIAKN